MYLSQVVNDVTYGLYYCIALQTASLSNFLYDHIRIVNDRVPGPQYSLSKGILSARHAFVSFPNRLINIWPL